jgi:hypothetical protein
MAEWVLNFRFVEVTDLAATSIHSHYCDPISNDIS